MWVKKGGRGKKKKTTGGVAGGEFDPQYRVFSPLFGPARTPAYWLDLRENALSLLISGPDSSAGDGEQ